MKKWAAAGLAAVVVGILVGLAAYQGSRPGLLGRKGALVSAEVAPAGGDAISTVSTLSLRSSTGLEVRALLRVPRAGPGPHPAAVLVGGIKRGRRVATVEGLETIARHAIVVSPDYPIEPRRRAWRGLALLDTAWRLRPAAFDTIAEILLLLDYLETRADVARHRLVLVGSSLGAPAVTIAGGVDARPAAVIALYGGGRLGSLVAHTLEHSERDAHSRWQAWLLGHALAWLVAPLAPERYVPAIAPRPFLMVNGAGDSMVPRANVLALYEAARPPRELIWVAGDHVQPSEADLIRRLSETIVTWLRARGLVDM